MPRGCVACDLAEGQLPLPGGLIHQSEHWRVEHCTGPLGVGTLIAKPKRHVLRVSELEPAEYLEMGPVIHHTASAVGELTDAVQVYVCLWSHGPVHIHYVVQPVLRDAIEAFSAYGPGLQAAMFAQGGSVDLDGAAQFAERARRWFTENHM